MDSGDSLEAGRRTAGSDDVGMGAGEARVGALFDGSEEAALSRIRTVAYLLDSSVRVPGTNFRFGLDPILGVLPGAGDLFSAALSVYIIVESIRLGVSTRTLLRMLLNLTIDTVGGSIPLLGNLFDLVWKANKRNLRLALRELDPDGELRDEVGRTDID